MHWYIVSAIVYFALLLILLLFLAGATRLASRAEEQDNARPHNVEARRGRCREKNFRDAA